MQLQRKGKKEEEKEMELSQRLKLAIAEYKNGNEEAFTPLYEESSK